MSQGFSYIYAQKEHDAITMKERIFTKDFTLVVVANFAIAVVMYGLQTTIAEYAASYGATSLLAGVVTGIYTLGGLATRLASSGWMKKLGWRKMALVFTSLHFIACLLYFAAVNLPLLILVRFLHGLTFGASASVMLTIGMSLVPKSRYGEGSGYLLMGPALAMAVGPYLSGYVMDNYGGTGGFLLSSAAGLLTAVCMGLADFSSVDPGALPADLDKSRPAKSLSLDYMIEPRALPVSLCIFLLVIGYSGIVSFIRAFGTESGLNTSFIFLMYAVFLLTLRPIAGRLQDRKGDNSVIYPGIALQAVGIGLLAVKPCMVTLIAAAFGAAMGFGNLSACIQAIAVKMTPDNRRSYGVTTFWICCDGGMGVGPMILGAVVSAGGYRMMYLTAALISLAALPLYHMVWGRKVK